MDGTAGELALVLLLVAAGAALTGSETALGTLRDSQIRRHEHTLTRLRRQNYHPALRIGTTLAGFLASATAATTLGPRLAEPLAFLGATARPAATLLTTAALTGVTLVIGHHAPRHIAARHNHAWAMLAARPVAALSVVTRPLVWALGKATDLVVRLAGADPRAGRAPVSPEKIRDMVAARRDISAEQRTIITGAFEITERSLREILVPRREILTLPTGQAAADALTTLIAAGHSRAPVVGPAGLDDLIGVVHLRDLIGRPGTVDTAAHPGTLLPGTLRISDALRVLRHEHQQLALVADEHGATAGLITMEDLVEEIIGEIYDESDTDDEPVRHEPDGAVLIPGTYPLHHLGDLGIPPGRAPSGYHTVAGLILAELGHIPTAPGEIVRTPAFTAEVAEITGRAITGVRLRTHHRNA